MVIGIQDTEAVVGETTQQWDRTPEDVQSEVESYLKYVGVFLRTERIDRGLQQQDIADRCGKSKAWVSHVENSKNESHAAAKAYAVALGVDFMYIVSQAEKASYISRTNPNGPKLNQAERG